MPFQKNMINSIIEEARKYLLNTTIMILKRLENI